MQAGSLSGQAPTNAARAAQASLSIREWALLLAISVCGLALRAWGFEDTGLDHFDEGAYAFSAQALANGDVPELLYPRQELFSPPVYFGLVGIAARTFGAPAATAAVGLNIALGTLTIAVLFQLVRRVFGTAAGLAAATLLAFNQFHIEFSRSGLTDIGFSLALLLSTLAIGSAIERGSVRSAAVVVAGVAIGIAWNIKYHGWLPIPIAVAALVCFVGWRRLCGRELELRIGQATGVGAVFAGVAFLCYLPWFLYVDSLPGGYAGLLDYQSDFVRIAPFRRFGIQAASQAFFDGPLSRAALPAAYLVGLLARPGVDFARREVLGTLGVLILGSLALGSAPTTMALTIPAIVFVLRGHAGFFEWLLLGLFGTFFVATPLYEPYARLGLPLALGTFALAAVWLTRPPANAAEGDVPAGGAGSRALAAAAVALVFGVSFLLSDVGNPWRSGRSMKNAVAEMNSVIGAGDRVSVFGEPALAYYFEQTGRPAFENLAGAGLEETAEPIYVVRGKYSRAAPPIAKRLEAFGDRMEHLASYAVRPGDMRLLDDMSADRAREYRREPDATFDLDLYRLQPAQR